MQNRSSTSRAVIGKAMLAVALVMFGLAAAYWFRAIPIPDPIRPIVSGALFAGGIVDLMVGLKYLQAR
jgi:hypothetical protein